MSLNFSYERVADQSLFISGNRWTTLGEVLPFVAMTVGIGKITATNAPEFFARVALYEQLNGAFRTTSVDVGQNSQRPFTPNEIHAAIGFSCNVVNESRASFLRRVSSGHMIDSTRQYAKVAVQAEAAR